MKHTILILATCFALLSGSAQAQTSPGFYPFLLTGVYYTTNAAGKIQTRSFTQQSLLKERAGAAGITDTKSMAVAYHVNGNDLGDTVDIIDIKTGTVLDTLMGFYFGQAFARVGLTNSTDTEERRIEYIYTDQDSHSMGAATIRKTYVNLGQASSTLRAQITGHIDYVRRSENNNGVRLFSGNFRTGPAFQFNK